MNLRLLDVVVKITHNPLARKTPDATEGDYLLLADNNGVLLKTTDGYYLAVRK